MAHEGILKSIPGLKASADLSAKQHYWVKISGPGTVDVCSAVTDLPCGILQNNPVAGREATVAMFGLSKAVGAAALTAGAIIGTAADGRTAAKVPGTNTTHFVCGQVIEGTGAANELATVMISLGEARAA